MRLPRVRLPRSALPLGLGALALAVAGCSTVPGLMPPTPVTSQGEATKNLYTIVFVIAVLVFVIVEGLILFAAIRFHRRPAQERSGPGAAPTEDPLPKQVHGHLGLELLWTGIPIVIVMFLFVISWQTLNTVQAKAASPLNVTVVGFQWDWEFIYPDPSGDHAKDLTFIGTPDAPAVLTVPSGETVQVSLRSQDVIHAFYVPQFLFKEDVVPGRDNTFQFKIDAPGTYRGQCAEFCGLGHAQMVFSVHALEPAQFDAWLAAQRAKAAATPTPAPSASPGASASGSSAGASLQLSAQNVQFSTKTLTAPANAPFSIAFDNKDSVVHNVTIHQGSPTGPLVFDPHSFVSPGTSTTYQVSALPPGTYSFVCAVHPTTMIGTLTVK